MADTLAGRSRFPGRSCSVRSGREASDERVEFKREEKQKQVRVSKHQRS